MPPPRTKTGSSSGRLPPASGSRASLLRKVQGVEEWGARKQLLSQDIARDLRTVITDAVVRRYRYRSPLMRELTKAVVDKAWPKRSSVVSIEGATGERLAGTEVPAVSFPRTALNSQFFQSLLRARDDVRTARAEDVRRLATIAEANAVKLSAALQNYLAVSDSDLVCGLRASLLGAALAGRAWPGLDEPALLSTAFDDGRGWDRGDRTLRIRPWAETLEFHLRRRGALVDNLRDSMGVAQGRGAVQMLDAARALPLLRIAADEWTWAPDAEVPEWVKPAVNGFARWEILVSDQFAQLSTILAHIRRLLPAGTSGSDTVQDVRRSLKESEKVGLAPSRDDNLRIEALLTKADQANWRVLPELENDLRKARSADSPHKAHWNATVIAVARDRGESLHAIQNFLDASDQMLDEALAKAEARSNPTGDDAVQQVQRLLQDWGGLYNEEGREQ